MTTIRLSQTAPWNQRLTNPYRTRFTEVDGRYFKIEANWLTSPWTVWELDADDDFRNQDPETSFVAIVFNLTQAREVIRARVGGAQ